jgi:hypothetical protein
MRIAIGTMEERAVVTQTTVNTGMRLGMCTWDKAAG